MYSTPDHLDHIGWLANRHIASAECCHEQAVAYQTRANLETNQTNANVLLTLALDRLNLAYTYQTQARLVNSVSRTVNGPLDREAS